MSTYKKFADYYDLIYKGIVNYESECQILEAIFKKYCLKNPKSILDLGCGTGSHTVQLTKYGYNVTGIDISPTMIEKARKKTEKENINAKFLVQDMRNLDLKTKFHCAVCMFGAFGYLLADKDLTRFFSALSQNLEEAGLFVFEYWNIGGLKPSPYKSWMKTQDKNVTIYRLSESNFDRGTNVLNIDMFFIIASKDKPAEIFTENHKIRCYTMTEIEKLIESNGFKLVFTYNWDTKDSSNLRIPEKETFRILAVSGKKD